MGGLFRAMCGQGASVTGYKECIIPYLMKKPQNQHLQHLNEFTALRKPYNA